MNWTMLLTFSCCISIIVASFPHNGHVDIPKELIAELAGERNDGIPDRGKRSYGSGQRAYGGNGGQLDGILYGILLQKLIAPPPAAAPPPPPPAAPPKEG
ncbi:hypothetical protein RvY_07092 [Ramazzottius varieornatus]|uniref:Uncharacterized protein n=1 Tax=Ramazzottius varieornatus TaxID=947166 RepID=A0A1D1V3L5_RAMVA|nr:hypothetical protein RvY_07092 [Ramazzottius varieornatus]